MRKNSNRRPLLFITFPQEFRKSNKFGHWTSGSGGKRTCNWSEQMKKKKPPKKNLFLPRQFYTLYEHKFSNLRPLLSITFPKDSENLKSLHIGLQEAGGKRPFKGLRNTNTKKFLLNKAKVAKKKYKYILSNDFSPFISKIFQI